MNKLEELLRWLDLRYVHIGKSYVYFQDYKGEAYTVFFDERTNELVVSGKGPNVLLNRFSDPVHCARHMGNQDRSLYLPSYNH